MNGNMDCRGTEKARGRELQLPVEGRDPIDLSRVGSTYGDAIFRLKRCLVVDIAAATLLSLKAQSPPDGENEKRMKGRESAMGDTRKTENPGGG